MRRLLKKKVLVGIISAGVLIGLGVLGKDLLQKRTIQIRNSIRAQSEARLLELSMREQGAYPAEVSALDEYGREFLYRTNGKDYLLVSFGRDGTPDQEYEFPLDELERSRNCYDLDADTVWTSSGSVRSCLK